MCLHKDRSALQKHGNLQKNGKKVIEAFSLTEWERVRLPVGSHSLLEGCFG